MTSLSENFRELIRQLETLQAELQALETKHLSQEQSADPRVAELLALREENANLRAENRQLSSQLMDVSSRLIDHLSQMK